MPAETFTFWSQQAFQGLFTATQSDILMPPHTPYGWRSVSWSSGSAVLFRAKQDTVKPLRPLIAASMQPLIQQMLSQVNQQFGGAVTLTQTGGPFTQITLWPQVPYCLSRPEQHGLTTQLLRIDIDLHVALPWPASDADANLSWYVFVRLEAGRLKADVDGAWVLVNGGWPKHDDIAKGLGDAAIAAIPKLNSGLHGLVDGLAGLQFQALYLIPGDGSTAAVTAGLANVDTALAVVPQ